MEAAFELFDHTADIGIRVRAPRLADLLAPAAAGLYEVIGQIETTGDSSAIRYELTGEDPAVLLRDYLAELVVLLEQDGLVATETRVEEFGDTRLAVEATVRRVDDDHSSLHREVKAVTYHELAIEEIAGGFEATVIVDI